MLSVSQERKRTVSFPHPLYRYPEVRSTQVPINLHEPAPKLIIHSIIIIFFDNFIFFFAAGPSCAKRREHTLATPNMTPASPRERARDSTTPRTGRRARPLIDLLPLASCRGRGRAPPDRRWYRPRSGRSLSAEGTKP